MYKLNAFQFESGSVFDLVWPLVIGYTYIIQNCGCHKATHLSSGGFQEMLIQVKYPYNHATASKFLHSTDLYISRVSVSILSTPSSQCQGSQVHLWPQVDTGPLRMYLPINWCHVCYLHFKVAEPFLNGL